MNIRILANVAARIAAIFASTILLSAQELGPCTIETVAGGYEGLPPGDGGPAGEAELYNPQGVRRGPDGLIYIADRDQGVI